jgi:hypothetical protein
MASQQDMVRGHRRTPSVRTVKIDGEKDSSGPAFFSDSAPLSLSRSQQSSFQVRLQAQTDATANANRSAAQLRRVAMRLAARLSVSDSRVTAYARSLERVRMSQYTSQRNQEAQIARLCSTLDEKVQKARDLAAILVQIAPIESAPLCKPPKNHPMI